MRSADRAKKKTARKAGIDPVSIEPDPDAGELAISTRFMEQFEILRPVLGGTDLSAFANAGGSLDIYSAGTGNRVFRIREQSDARAGWTELDLGIIASQLYPYVSPKDAVTSRQNPHILGVNNVAVLTRSMWDGNAQRYVQSVSQPADNTKKLKRFLAALSVLGDVHANVILETDEVATSFMNKDGVWQSRQWVPIKESEGSAQNAKVKQIAVCSNNPVQAALYAIGMNNEVLFSPTPFRFSFFVRLGATFTAMALDVVEDNDKLLNIIAIDTKKHLWQKRQKRFTAPGVIEWDDWVAIDKVTEVTALRAVLGFNNQIEVYSIGTDGSLFITRGRDEAGRRTWSETFPLGNPMPNNIFTVGRNGQGYSELFSVTRDNRLLRFWQDPATTQWYNYEIALEDTGQMVSVPAHSVQFTVLDARKVPKPDARVVIRTSTLVPIRINGLYYTTSELVSAEVKSNSAGVVVVQRFTNTLTAPSLFIWTEFMPDTEGVVVEPNAQLQDKMHRTSSDEVWNAKGAGGEPLLKGEYRTRENAEAIASIMRESMALGYPAANASSLRFIAAGRRRTGLRHVSVEKGVSPFRLDASRVHESHWRVEITDAGPRFTKLTREGAAELVEQRLSTAAVSGFLGVDWGDVWNSIKNGVSSVLGTLRDFIVNTIIDPITGLVDKIKVVFRFIVDGIEKIFDTVIELFQQAFDIIEGIWNTIKVFFEDLYRWLAFLFAWGDIRRTADAVEHSFNTTLDFIVTAVRSVRDQVDKGMTEFEKEVKKWMDDFIAKLGGESVQRYLDDNNRPNAAVDEGTGHNPLFNAFQDNYKNANTGDVAKTTASLADGPLDALVAELVKLADNFQFGSGKQAFDEGILLFSKIGEDPDNVLNLLMAGILKTMEALVLWGIAAARGVVLSILDLMADLVDAVKSMLNEEWEIPFVSQLYKLITGDTLSFRPMRIFAYIAAIPATLIYKIIDGSAPYPDEASVDAFKKNYTVAWLMEVSGLKTARQLHGAAQAALGDWRKTTSKIFTAIFAATMFVRIWIDTATALASSGAFPAPTALVVTNLAARFLTMFMTTPWIYSDAGGFGCTKGPLNNLRWLLNIIFGPLRGTLIFLFRNKIPDDKRVLAAEGTLTLWGVAHLGFAIGVAAWGVWSAGQIVVGILSTLAPQALRFAAIKEVVKATKGISLPALIILIVLTYMVILLAQVANVFGDDAEEANHRVLALGFAV